MQILKLKNFSFLLLICASLLVVISCGDDDEEPETGCTTENLTYDNFAREFITSNCGDSNCHSSSAAEFGTFAMIDYTSTKAAVDNGRILGAINREDGFNAMPKGEPKLSDCNISKMTAWINDGALEN